MIKVCSLQDKSDTFVGMILLFVGLRLNKSVEQNAVHLQCMKCMNTKVNKKLIKS